ncbi:hypothetical protein M758_9G158500 [Ceratodon purpureus]|nr:hypothetical protein M758_9G158500 [Ceratodon purpureus]
MIDIPQHALYPMPELSLPNSVELFIWCAFRKVKLHDVDISFHESVNKVSKACGGVPLVLEVMGGFLANKQNEPECWTKVIFGLRNHGDILQSLKISYDGLTNKDDKQMFVDVACLMLGHPTHVALAVWDSIEDYKSPSWSLKRLIDKCLVKVDDKGLLRMHDLLRDMGRNIVKENASEKQKLPSHIWSSSSVVKIIQKKHGLKKVLGLSLIGVDSSTPWQAKAFAKMKELRYLLLDGCSINGNFSTWSEDLRWLQWRYCSHGVLPSDLKLPHLSVLNINNSSNLTHVWDEDLEECPYQRLQILLLNNCIKLNNLPPTSCKLKKLKVLEVRSTRLKGLPEDFSDLCNLVKVDFSNCKKLVGLPESFGNLSKLEKLNLRSCQLVQSLPASFCKLTKLKSFNVRYSALEGLPDDFGDLCNLVKVDFSNCKKLVGLPESFGNLSKLEKVDLQWCQLVQRLPASFCKLTELKVFDVSLTALEGLPDDFGDLCNLVKVDFSYCKKLVGLPESFGNLSKLEVLSLRSCQLVQRLPASFCKLTKLKVFYVQNTRLAGLPDDIGELCNLVKVEFTKWYGGDKFVGLPESLGNLSKLEKLTLHWYRLLRSLPASFCKLTKLKVFSLIETRLERLPDDFGNLCNLVKVEMVCCKKLVGLPESFGNLSKLEELNLRWCQLVQSLPASFCKLTKLKSFNVRFSALEGLPEDFGNLCNLVKVDFSNCKKLVGLPESFGNLSKLEELDLQGCQLVQRLPVSFCELTKLKVLAVSWTALEGLPEDFGDLCNLVKVDFSNCKRFVGLPESFGNLSNLEELDLQWCQLVQRLPASFCELTKLKVFEGGVGTDLVTFWPIFFV